MIKMIAFEVFVIAFFIFSMFMNWVCIFGGFGDVYYAPQIINAFCLGYNARNFYIVMSRQ